MTTPSHTDLHRDLGKMEAGLEALTKVVEKGFEDTSDRLDKVETRLASLEASEHRRSGAFRFGQGVWAFLLAVSGLLGGVIATHLSK